MLIILVLKKQRISSKKQKKNKDKSNFLEKKMLGKDSNGM